MIPASVSRRSGVVEYLRIVQPQVIEGRGRQISHAVRVIGQMRHLGCEALLRIRIDAHC